MFNLTKNKIIDTNFFNLLILFFFSFFINFYYSKQGTFPIDTFLHYDSGSRILNGDLPIRDFWIVSGLTTDILQSLFFKVFGINWFAYVMHSSLFNSVISIMVYLFFCELKLNKTKALLLSISFATLSYTISATPFVDLHATYFLLIATLLIINYFKTSKIYFWPVIIFLIFLSFFSKQVPVAYAGLLYSLILTFYFIFKKKYEKIIIIIITIVIFLFITYLLLKMLKIEFESFYIQFIDYPRSIGSERLANFEISLISIFNKYKFILIPLTYLIYLIFAKKISLENKVGFLVFFSFTIVMLFHQLMTKNQIYIYFLVPLLFGFLESEIQKSKKSFKKFISHSLIILLAFITIKYHFRFNENRKFHELSKIQINQSIKAEGIHSSLKGLYWKNPHYLGGAQEEISILKKGYKMINNTNKKIMLISHYQFLDSISVKKLNAPNKTFTSDGASMPLIGNKYYEFYKNFLNEKIKKKNIDEIWFFKHENIPGNVISNYISNDCFKIKENNIFLIYELICSK
ncbi:MAG: hypothetical protein ISQ17_03630 [Pelagibacteraceae bacterium]|nr:hypothetical protein [Pelagibacteraceae bacterium]